MEGCLAGQKESLFFEGSVCDIIEASIKCVSCIPDSHVTCMVCIDDCLPAVLAVSSMINEVANRPIPVVSDYRLPGWLSGGSTAILVSYTDDSAGCMQMYEKLKDRGCRVVCLTSNEKLIDLCQCDGVEIQLIPPFIQYCKVMGYIIGTLTSMLDNGGIHGLRRHVLSQMERIRDFEKTIGVEVERISPLLKGKIVSTYVASDTISVAMCERISLGKLLENLSFYGELPEFDHNELVGWSDPNNHAPELAIFVMQGSREEGLVHTIVDCMLEVLEENGRQVVSVNLGIGPSIRRNVCGMILSDAILTDLRRYLR